MEQKKFMDIKRIVQENEMHKNKNTWAFEPGDHIVIQIKIDGSNASVGMTRKQESLRRSPESSRS